MAPTSTYGHYEMGGQTALDRQRRAIAFDCLLSVSSSISRSIEPTPDYEILGRNITLKGGSSGQNKLCCTNLGSSTTLSAPCSDCFSRCGIAWVVLHKAQ
jgi:hypothetical protein